MAGAAGPAVLAERLSASINLMHRAMAQAPGVLIRPSYNALNEAREELITMAAEREAAAAADADGEKMTELRDKDAAIEKLIADIEGMLRLIPGPWQNPPLLRELRAKEARLAESLSNTRKLQRKHFPGTSQAPKSVPYWDSEAIRNEALMNQYAASMAPQQSHVPVWSMIHAAGTQFPVPIKDHHPAQFEKVFACKAMAAWQINYLNAWRP